MWSTWNFTGLKTSFIYTIILNNIPCNLLFYITYQLWTICLPNSTVPFHSKNVWRGNNKYTCIYHWFDSIRLYPWGREPPVAPTMFTHLTNWVCLQLNYISRNVFLKIVAHIRNTVLPNCRCIQALLVKCVAYVYIPRPKGLNYTGLNPMTSQMGGGCSLINKGYVTTLLFSQCRDKKHI